MITEIELPIAIEIMQPHVGDRIVEDANFGNYRLNCLVREGRFLKAVPVKGVADRVAWLVELDNGKQGFFDPSICKITERAAASVLVEESKTETPLEPQFKVGDRVYQENPDNTGVINKISRGKALVSVGDRTVIVPIGRLHHCDPNYSPKPKKSQEEILAEEEAAIAKAREEYLKSQIELPFDYEIPDGEKGNECYTPAYVLDLCRDFLGGFDLDPFSNAIAQRTVRSETFWTKEDNALSKDWSSFNRKWCNPPYRKLANDGIIDKILSYIHIGETLLLVNSSTSAKWFHKCMDACTAYLHPNKRIPFYNPYSEIEYKNGKKRSGNEHDQTLFYFGDRPLEFAEALANLGNAVQPIRKDNFAISISGEALIVETINAKQIEFESAVRSPIQIAENRELYDLLKPICDWYSGRYLPIFAVNALGHALVFARDGKHNEAVELLTAEVIAEIKKPHAEVRKLKAFLDNFVPSIEEISTEPKLPVAGLRMDEPKRSVLVETSQNDFPLERLKHLQAERDRLVAIGASPKGVWIEKSRPSKRNFDQAVWKADKPHEWLGGKHSRYIGEVGSKDHISAIAQHRAGQELRKVEREIKKLQVKS